MGASGTSALVGRLPVVAGALAALAVIAVLTLAGSTLILLGARPIGPASAGLGVSAGAVADIPPAFLRLYVLAAQRYGLDWSILAAIGKVECDHGRDPDPSCMREGAVNAAGAGGPAQFLSSTWARYGVDGDGDGTRDRWSPPDAIFAMANYLAASGAPTDYYRAIYAYNHAAWYVAAVLSWAARYRRAASAPAGSAAAQTVPGEQATLAPGDGHVALVPAGAPAAVQAMILAGNQLQHLPYGPAGHPDPRGAASEDCSSTVSYVLIAAGVLTAAEVIATNPLAVDYAHFGLAGPGRWVTLYATADHVFVTIAGLRLDTSHRGSDVGPNRDQDGPRWRILDHLPDWARWSVRHPPGL